MTFSEARRVAAKMAKNPNLRPVIQLAPGLGSQDYHVDVWDHTPNYVSTYFFIARNGRSSRDHTQVIAIEGRLTPLP